MSDPAEAAVERAARGNEHRIPPFDPEGDGIDCAREALKPIRDLEVPGFLEALAEILENLVMDTPKDQELTDRYVTMLRNAAANLRPLIYRSDELGEVEP